MSNPAVWIQDARELYELAIAHLRQGQTKYARRCAERFMMITIVQRRKLIANDANNFLKSLSNNDVIFQKELDKLMSKLSSEETVVEPIATSSRAYSLQPPNSGDISRETVRRGSTNERSTGLASDVGNERLSGQAFQQRAQQEPQEAAISYRGSGPPRQAQLVYSSYGQTSAEIEEASTYTGEFSLDDDITFTDQERREKGIDGKTRNVGPIRDWISSNYKGKDNLYASYRVYTGRGAMEFFVRGRVFSMVWHENAGVSAHPNATETSAPLDTPFNRFTINADGVTIFSHIRRFVIVKAKRDRRYCLAIPINTYRGQGLTDKRMRPDEQQAHTIIYARGSKPEPMPDEVELNKEPIEVELEPGEELKSSSRLHFGKVQSIDWNVKVKNVGIICKPTHLRRLLVNFDREFRKGDDTETEGEGKGKGKEKGRSNR